MCDFINGNKFSDIAQFIIDFDHNDLNTNIYRQNSIIFCKTDFIDNLFEFIKFSSRKYILITHMSDYPINEFRFKKAPNCIIKWYAENATFVNEKLIPIPLGLENHVGSSKGKFTNHDWFVNNMNKLKSYDKDDLLYCNWNQNTNIEIRKPIIDHLQSCNIPLCIEHGLTFENYCTNMSKHKFVVCPPGNGVDTHRLWEALYLGCYPIVLKHHIYENYDLPILQINKWSDINAKLLEQHDIKWNNKTNLEQLNMSYWTQIINNQYNNI